MKKIITGIFFAATLCFYLSGITKLDTIKELVWWFVGLVALIGLLMVSWSGLKTTDK